VATWRDALTPDELTLFRLAGYGRPVGFGDRPAALVIDVEYSFTGQTPEPILQAIRKSRYSCGERAWRSLPHIGRFLEAARRSRVPVFYTHGIPSGSDARSSGGGPIVAEVEPQPGDVIIAKPGPSAFFGTPLTGHLVRLRADTLLVAGCTTSGCVLATVIDGFSYGYRTIVVEECVFDRAETPHRVSLFDMNAKYADVLPLADVEAWLKQRAP
jgi:nicotinamidase-related amidase